MSGIIDNPKKELSTRYLVTIVALAIAVPLLLVAASTWIDYLWYQTLGYSAVFWTRIASQVICGLAAGLATALILLVTSVVAYKSSPGWVMGTTDWQSNGQNQATIIDNQPTLFDLKDFLLQLGDKLQPILRVVIGLLIVFVGFTTALDLGSQWETLRLALAQVPFAGTDPQFGLNISFYVFIMPALEIVFWWLLKTIFAAFVLTFAIYFLRGGITPWKAAHKFAPHVKAHLSALLALFVTTIGARYVMECFRLNFSPRGQVLGASYTDVHAQLPAYILLVAVSAIAAILLLINIKRKGWKLPLYALGTWLVISIIAGGVIPTVVQQLIVQPNEATLEQPYIERNIKMTREAFNLSDVSETSFAAKTDLSTKTVDSESTTIDNIRLWDPAIAQKSYTQLQAIRPYYDFADVDMDRYEIDGKQRQVMVSLREMNSDQLASTAQTWVNQHLVYTHGYGAVMTSASEADTRGLPQFIIGDIPPKVNETLAPKSPALEIKQPRIYFGEATQSYAIVNSGIDEFDFPQGEKNATYRYEADSGIKVGGIGRRLAWAVTLESAQMLFSNYVKSDSRVLMHRNVADRVTKLAPWLTLEQDIYSTIVDGKLIYILDGYTTSSTYPYAQRTEDGINYIRGSVKVTVDAYSGETKFYAFDAQDPILKAWRTVFPEMFAEASEIPDSLRQHFRYPEGLFSTQAYIYRTYHMTDPNVFYNKEDQWEIPGAATETPMQPYFVLLKLPGSDREKFYLMQPYTPRNRDNMIGWMAVSCDTEDYGKRTVYLFPKERVILGPEQITARINQDPVISPQLSLWNQRGSQVLFGNMVVIPIKESIVYIQPLFLQAEKTAIPELASVVVAFADEVVMDKDLKSALAQVFNVDSSADAAVEGGENTGDGVVPGTDGETKGKDGSEGSDPADEGNAGSSNSLANKANALYREALSAQKVGDWATYGIKIEQLGKILEQIAK